MAPADGPDPDDPLRILSDRLDRASETAERLLADAAAHVAAGAVRKAPPAGWQQAAPPGDEGDEGRAGSLFGSETELLLNLLASVRDRIPPDLQRRLTEAVRDLLLALRALIDWYLERSERERSTPVTVRDIPIL